jgi:hypothetical protein
MTCLGKQPACAALLALALVLPADGTAARPTRAATVVTLTAPDGSVVRIERHGTRPAARSGPPWRTLRIDPGPADHLRASDSVSVAAMLADGEHAYHAIAASRPSRGNRSAGYCGSGDEAHLLLVEITQRALVLKDGLLMASCLYSEELDGEGASPGRAPEITDVLRQLDRNTLAFRWLGDPAGHERHLRANKGRWSVALVAAPARAGSATAPGN